MIKNIIFDLGNVLIDIDFPRSEKMLKQILGDDLLQNLEKNNQQNVFLDFEVGKINEATFISILKNAAVREAPDEEIIAAWNAMLLHFKPERFDMLRRLAKKYTLYVLSNTNETHIEWVRKYLKQHHNIENYETTFFQKVYYSHEIHLRKPNANIYEYVLADAKLIASQTLFIDDNFENVESAKSLGIHVIHHVLGNEIVEALQDF